jgi:2-polyprenyl-3-methyl-5-hydroxy-6-metoxy-1,4-benzoquinol methylase
MDVSEFENARWTERPIRLQRWHVLAADLVREQPILDIGGGDGVFARLLIERGFDQVTVGDISSVAVEHARASGLDAHIIDVRQASLPYQDREFGTVTMLNLLEHLYDPLALLRECARISQSVVIVVPNFHYWKHRVAMLVGRVPFESKPHRGHVHWFNERMLRQVIAQADMEVEEWTNITALWRLPGLWTALARAKPMLFASAYVVHCRPAEREALKAGARHPAEGAATA